MGEIAKNQKPIRQVKWILLLDNIINVNVDGSSLSNLGRSGFGGLIKKIMVIGYLVFLDFVVLLLAWRLNCMSFFMAFVLRMMRAT